MKTYEVTMKHDGGTVRLRVRAANHNNAINNACAAERAPENSVESCHLIETPTQARKSVRMAVRHFAAMRANPAGTRVADQRNEADVRGAAYLMAD